MGFISSMYRATRIAADIRAATRGPLPLLRRFLAKPVYSKVNGLTARVLNKAFKATGLK